MKNNFIIRTATVDDVPSTIPVWFELLEYHRRLDDLYTLKPDADKGFADFMTNNIDSDNWLVLVAEVDGQIIAYNQNTICEYPPGLTTSRYGSILDMAVAQKYRRLGIGTALIERALPWFAAKEVSRVEVRMHMKNEVSNAFWHNLGFDGYAETAVMKI